MIRGNACLFRGVIVFSANLNKTIYSQTSLAQIPITLDGITATLRIACFFNEMYTALSEE